MSRSYSFGKVTGSQTALYFTTGITPGGCSVATTFLDRGDLSGLLETPRPDLGVCEGYFYDDLAPIASGDGPALACPDSNYISLVDPCYGGVVWSKDTFEFEKQEYGGAVLYMPSSCALQPKIETWENDRYICEGGSIVRAARDGSTCGWDGSTFLCSNCRPRYAPQPCDSDLGNHPNAPVKDEAVPDPTDGTGVPPSTSPPPPTTPSSTKPKLCKLRNAVIVASLSLAAISW